MADSSTTPKPASPRLRRPSVRVAPEPSQASPSSPSLPAALASPAASPDDPDPDRDNEPPASPPPAFRPLFALVNNSSTDTTHHPRVHYIFSDDDPDVLAAALARLKSDDADSGGAGGPRPSRSVLLDLAPGQDGRWEVACASSLSPDFAVVGSAISKLEDGGARDARARDAVAGSDSGSDSAPLVLRVEGIEAEAAPGPPSAPAGVESDHPSSSGSGALAPPKEDYAALIDDFNKRLASMRRAYNAGEARRRRFAEEEGVEEHESAPDAPPETPGAPPDSSQQGLWDAKGKGIAD